MADRKKQWPQSVLAPWAWHAEPRRVERWRDRVWSGDGGILGSRALVVSVILSVVFVSVGMVGWTSGAFSSAADNAGNSFQAATSFCDTPGTTNLTATEDSWVYELQPTTNFGSDANLYVYSKPSENIRTLVKFALPSVPAGCSVTSARLSLFSTFAATGRTIQAFQAASAWTEAGVTWNNKPATTGTAATSASGTDTRSWSVTSQVQAMYSGSNNGFVLRDSVEGGASLLQAYTVRTTSTPPVLSVTLGSNGSACASPGTVTVTSDADSYVISSSPTTNSGTAVDIWVGSSVNFGNARALVAFPMPALPANCTVTAATLRLNSTFSGGARTIQVFRPATAWSESTVTWNTVPATLGTAPTTTAAVGWNQWTVTSQVQGIYAWSDNGFLVRDQTEGAAGDGFWQQYKSRESATDPELVVTFG